MLSFFPRGVLDEILNLIESVSEEFPAYSLISFSHIHVQRINIFMYGILIVYSFSYYLNIGYLGIFLVISVNLQLFR